VRTLSDGGQEPIDVARALAAFIAEATSTLEVALYDFKLEPATARTIADAVKDAKARGVAVRLVYNDDHGKPVPIPPPPRTDPEFLALLDVPARAIPGIPDLMHHKYVIRDGSAVWSGSTNWTEDSWSREENVIVTVASPDIAARYRTDFEQLWKRGEVDGSGDVDPVATQVGPATVRTWFCPENGSELAHRIAKAIGRARTRVRIASPVITSGPILGTLAEVAADGKLDVAGVVDATQIQEVYGQWRRQERTRWKLVNLGQVLTYADFTGKRSTPYRPGSIHDYMHAKVTVADDVTFVGSFNLSHSGEMNAENVLEIRDPGLADRLAAFIDTVRALYPKAPLPDGRGPR
jgi:phosphatidylserine/phosphatidylglycerophosphate/cardiolipin synthase-like enzyme